MRRLSQIIPVHFSTAYRAVNEWDPPEGTPQFASWWQWRGRIWRHRTTAI